MPYVRIDFEPHPSHQMSEWNYDATMPRGNAAHGRHCTACGLREMSSPGAHYIEEGLDQRCPGTNPKL